MTRVVGVGREGTPCQVEERQIVIAGNSERAGDRERAHEGGGARELLGAGALRDVAAEHEEIWLELSSEVAERANDGLDLGAEVWIRHLQDHGHPGSSRLSAG